MNEHDGMKVWENNFRYTKTNPYVNTKADLDLLKEKGAFLKDLMKYAYLIKSISLRKSQEPI